MKRVDIVNNVNGLLFSGTFDDDSKMQTWIDLCIDKDFWGQKERTKDADALTQEEQLQTPISTQTIQREVLGNIVDILTITLPAEYTVSIIDLEADADYLLEKCYKERKEAYGPLDAQLDEIYHDIDAWKARLAAIKLAIPKP